MKEHFSTPLTSPLYPPPPYHYDDARLFLALFYAPEESLASILPAPLRPPDMPLMALLFAEQPCRETGIFTEGSILAQCIFDNPESGEEEVGVYFVHDWVNTDVALAAGREIWGYPRKIAETSLELEGDTLVATVVRDGMTLLKATCKLEEEGEWIDSGPNINVHLIPEASAEGHVVAEVTAAYLEYAIKSGRSGDVEIEIQNGPRDELSAIKVDGTMVGLYFDTDIVVPPGKVIAKIDL
ncbi:MAG: acetoacetate decarboxylase family protein [Candidatus Thorarchaeota archaeon]